MSRKIFLTFSWLCNVLSSKDFIGHRLDCSMGLEGRSLGLTMRRGPFQLGFDLCRGSAQMRPLRKVRYAVVFALVHPLARPTRRGSGKE